MLKYTHYINDISRGHHRFSILYGDDGFGNLIPTKDSIDMAVEYIQDGLVNNH